MGDKQYQKVCDYLINNVWEQHSVCGLCCSDDMPILDLPIGNLNEGEQLVARRILVRDLGIHAQIEFSESMGNIYVLRISGEDGVRMAKKFIPSSQIFVRPEDSPKSWINKLEA